MGLTDSYAYFLPIHYLYQIVSINLCHNYRQICFYDCAFLKSVMSGSGLEWFQSFAFGNCDSRQSFTYNGTREQWFKVNRESSWGPKKI